MPFSTKHIAASVLGNAAIVASKRLHTDNKNPAEETVENTNKDASKNNPFMPRRLYQEENNLDSITLDDVELSLHLDGSPSLLKNGKESILRDRIIQDSSSSSGHRDMGILPDKGSQEAHRMRRRLKPKSTKAPKASKKCKGSCAPESSAPSSMPSIYCPPYVQAVNASADMSYLIGECLDGANGNMCPAPYNVTIECLDTSQVTSMNWTFAYTDFNGNLDRWQTHSVTDMSGMFLNATAFNQPLDNFDTSSVEHMRKMFYYAGAFNQCLSSWNITSVTTMTLMLNGTSCESEIATPTNFEGCSCP